ncbi:hypothetical protein DsansV1_C10g0102621 [Dioscorea sansibarensis]
MTTILFLIVFSFLALSFQCYGSERKVHIVYMGGRSEGVSSPSLSSMHHSMLTKVLPR